jgi:signal transduction histidine kinase
MGVAIRRLKEIVVLTVTDDGRGFDVHATRQASAGLGLVSMEERVRLLNGTLEIISDPQGGTSIVVEIPVDAGLPTPAVDQASPPETVVAEPV